MITLRPGMPDDLPTVISLLEEAGLPCEDIAAADLPEFLVASGGPSVLGVVGLERYGKNALLRSLAVRPASRHTGLGSQLADAAEARASATGVKTLYLLTTTAAAFFARRGYEVIARGEAPPALQQTAAFSRLCPSQAICLRRQLIPTPSQTMP